MTIILITAAAWIGSGIWFWAMVNVWDGWPSGWHNENSRVRGWDGALFGEIPVCALFGPLLWITKGVFVAMDYFGK